MFLVIVPVASYSIAFTPQIYPAHSSPYGVSYADWIKKWWQWDISIPTTIHPQASLNTTTCPVGNSGKVSFLSHNLQGEATYTCVIPAWERYNGSYFHRISTPPEAHGSDKPADLFDCATTGDMFLTFTVKLDGIVLTKGVFNKLNENYTKTSIFNMNVPSNNFENLKGEVIQQAQVVISP